LLVSQSTQENYASSEKCFYGPYAEIRATLDSSYHGNYTRQRQASAQMYSY
jgi:hypothetical protein